MKSYNDYLMAETGSCLLRVGNCSTINMPSRPVASVPPNEHELRFTIPTHLVNLLGNQK